MKYKDNQNKIHVIESGFEHLMSGWPIGYSEISDAEENALINTPSKLKADANNLVLAQIAALESQVTARVWREYITKPNTAIKNGKTPAQFITDIDTQIATLRGTLIA